MSNSDEDRYRREAESAQEFADKARTDRDRSRWLQIAQSWMSMVRSRERTQEETFDDRERAEGTKQDISKGSQ